MYHMSVCFWYSKMGSAIVRCDSFLLLGIALRRYKDAIVLVKRLFHSSNRTPIPSPVTIVYSEDYHGEHDVLLLSLPCLHVPLQDSNVPYGHGQTAHARGIFSGTRLL